MTGEMVIEARGLTKRFGKTVALDDVDLNIPRGAAFGLLGPSGSGKSTIVRLLTGLARPSGGTLTIEGAAPGSVAARRRFGVVLQDGRLYGWMTGREVLAFAADLAGVASADLAGLIEGVAKRFSLEDSLDTRVASMAAATRARLAIAQALAGEPDVLVLDEPFQDLDPEGRADVIAILRNLRGTTTIVLAAHRFADVEALCDRVAVLEAGRILRTSKVEAPAPMPRSVPVVETGEAASAPRPLAARLAGFLLELLRELRR